MQALSAHARTRMQQRAIRPEMIDLALRYGTIRYCHGSRVYEVRDRSLVGTPYERMTERLRGLAVVVGGEGCVTTVKWAYHLRRRPGVCSGKSRRERAAQGEGR